MKMNVKKIVKRLLYFSIHKKIGNKSFIVPVVKGAGLQNLKLKNDWFCLLLDKIKLPEN